MKGAALLIVAAAAALSAGGAEARLGASAPQYVLDAAAMGAPTDCSQFGRRAADKQGVPEIKASPCEIGGTAAKAETCTHTELCILEYVGQEVHKAVQAVNAHLPDTMKENMEIAVSSATAVAEGCMGAYVELEESKHWLMGYAMSAGEYFAEKVGSTTFEKMKSFFTNWVKGKKVAPAPAGATPADEAEAEALAEDKMEAIFLHSALFMRSLQLRAALIAIAENKGGFGGREIDPAHVKLLAKAADSLPKTMADLSALAKSLEASKNEERLRNFMRWGVQVAADTGLGIGAATVYPFVAAGLKNAGLPTLGDLAADALVFDTQTRNNFQLVLASIQATSNVVEAVAPVMAAHPGCDMEVTAEKQWVWKSWGTWPKKEEYTRVVTSDVEPAGKNQVGCEAFHALAKVSNGAMRDALRLGWLIWARSSTPKPSAGGVLQTAAEKGVTFVANKMVKGGVTADFNLQRAGIQAAIAWIAGVTPVDIEEIKYSRPRAGYSPGGPPPPLLSILSEAAHTALT